MKKIQKICYFSGRKFHTFEHHSNLAVSLINEHSQTNEFTYCSEQTFERAKIQLHMVMHTIENILCNSTS